ncbi:Retrotransposon gag protein [Arachis hypogaea]|nr:Retrotransposon gag protein [Arachis hypogaea]
MRTCGRHIRLTSVADKRRVRVNDAYAWPMSSSSNAYAWPTHTRDRMSHAVIAENTGGDFWATFDPISGPKILIRGCKVRLEGIIQSFNIHSHNFRF